MLLSEISNSHTHEHFWVLQGQHRDIYWFLFRLQFLPIDENVSSNPAAIHVQRFTGFQFLILPCDM